MADNITNDATAKQKKALDLYLEVDKLVRKAYPDIMNNPINAMTVSAIMADLCGGYLAIVQLRVGRDYVDASIQELVDRINNARTRIVEKTIEKLKDRMEQGDGNK